MARITVTHRHGQSFDIRVRGYALISDEPVTLGGDDEGPTPTELMVAGLAACAADEVVKCLAAMGEALEPTEVWADFAWDLEGRRVASIRLSVTLSHQISQNAREQVLRSMLTCRSWQARSVSTIAAARRNVCAKRDGDTSAKKACGGPATSG